MSAHDTWEITAVLPDDFQEFEDWVLQKADLDMNTVIGIVYHKHTINSKSTLYMSHRGKCRDCGAQAPPGLLFFARISKLDALGVIDDFKN